MFNRASPIQHRAHCTERIHTKESQKRGCRYTIYQLTKSQLLQTNRATVRHGKRVVNELGHTYGQRQESQISQRVCDNVPEGSTSIFGTYRIYF